MSYSKSIFFIPVWFDNFNAFTKELSKSQNWDIADSENYCPRYLLNYATRIANSKDLFRLFELNEPSSLNVYMFEDELELKNIPEIEQVRFSCFATGVGFLEFWVNYQDLTPEEITDFAYWFKKATKKYELEGEKQKKALYDVALGLLPKNSTAELFFTAAVQFKYECSCFHFMHLDECPDDLEKTQNRLFRLSRSYGTKLPLSTEGAYDI